MGRAQYLNLLNHFGSLHAAEIAVFAAWQANGLRAIHSWGAEALFGSPDIDLAYADGPSIFVKGSGHPNSGAGKTHPRVDDVVPLPSAERPLPEEAVTALALGWNEWGCPTDDWLRFLLTAPHVLWGWAQFHSLTFGEGQLSRRTKALSIALLASRIEYEPWSRGLVENGTEWSVRSEELIHLERSEFDHFDAKTAAALRYVDRLEAEFETITDEFVIGITGELNVSELVELGFFAGMQMGSIRLAQYLSRHALYPSPTGSVS